VNEVPAHTRRLVQRLLERYCERICPPGARYTVTLSHEFERDRATLFENRLICGVPNTRRCVPLAQFRYDGREHRWRLWYADARWTWRRYPGRDATRNFIELLRDIDADRDGFFFGRINGKSLRWCSAEGRCSDCELRYGQILGCSSPAGRSSGSLSVPWRSSSA
jgi:hypothetical protein